MGRQGTRLLIRAARTVLILGGGVGGLVAARRLRAKLPRRDRVIVVERSEQHLFQPSLLWVLTGARQADFMIVVTVTDPAKGA